LKKISSKIFKGLASKAYDSVMRKMYLHAKISFLSFIDLHRY
jgi:hypothetical protein